MPALGPTGVCAYIAGFAIPFEWDIPLTALALLSVLATVSSSQNSYTASSSLILPVVIFLLATGLSILVSKDIGRSV
jgi:hypothetical protein